MIRDSARRIAWLLTAFAYTSRSFDTAWIARHSVSILLAIPESRLLATSARGTKGGVKGSCENRYHANALVPENPRFMLLTLLGGIRVIRELGVMSATISGVATSKKRSGNEVHRSSPRFSGGFCSWPWSSSSMHMSIFCGKIGLVRRQTYYARWITDPEGVVCFRKIKVMLLCETSHEQDSRACKPVQRHHMLDNKLRRPAHVGMVLDSG